MTSVLENIKELLKMGRFHFLLGGLLLYAFGAFFSVNSGAQWDPLRFFLGYLVFAPAHLSVSYSNDCFDIHADSFNKPTLFSGGSGVLTRRPDLKKASLVLAISLIVLSLVLSVPFSLIFGFSFLLPIFVLVGALIGWFYTAPPFRLSYRGLGEVSTIIAIGLLVPFMGFYVMDGRFVPSFLYIVPASLLYGAVFIINVEVPDMEADQKGGKNTLITRIGREKGLLLSSICTILATAYLTILMAFEVGPSVSRSGSLALGSLPPLIISVLPFLPFQVRKDRKVVFTVLNMGSLFIFLILVDSAMLLSV